MGSKFVQSRPEGIQKFTLSRTEVMQKSTRSQSNAGSKWIKNHLKVGSTLYQIKLKTIVKWSQSCHTVKQRSARRRPHIFFSMPGMFRARPRWAVSASGLAVLDRAGPAQPPDPSLLLARPGQPNPSLLSTGPWASAAPNPSLLSTGPRPAWPQPLTSIGQTPHFY